MAVLRRPVGRVLGKGLIESRLQVSRIKVWGEGGVVLHESCPSGDRSIYLVCAAR